MQLAVQEHSMSRRDLLSDFVASSPAKGAEIHMLAGDASFRKYWRVLQNEKSWVVMDAPPDHEDIRPFIAITNLLTQAGLCVPKIYAQDASQGFLLLEDLGDNLFSRHLEFHTSQEKLLYQHACESLVSMHSFSVNATQIAESLPLYDNQVYLREVALFSDWFLVQVLGRQQAFMLRDSWQHAWQKVLSEASLKNNCIVHRDYHADNLLWLPERDEKVGMLDYQDALRGDALYDVISLLEDARRDVTLETVDACKRFIQDAHGINNDDFLRRYHVLAAQRNAKIIGIFTRLCVRDGKMRYLDYLPRVWQHFLRDLQHPILSPVADFVNQHVPPHYQGVFSPDVSLGGL